MELRSILTATKVSEISVAEPPILKPTDTVAAAARKMRGASHGSAIICDESGKLIGIFTERDLLRLIDSGSTLETPLSEAMTRDPKTLTTEDTLFDATRSMDEGGYRRLPVVDADGAPAGIVDTKTISHFLVEHFPQAIYNQASHSQLIAKEREGA